MLFKAKTLTLSQRELRGQETTTGAPRKTFLSMNVLHKLTILNVKDNLQSDFVGDILTKTLYVLYLSAPEAF